MLKLLNKLQRVKQSFKLTRASEKPATQLNTKLDT